METVKANIVKSMKKKYKTKDEFFFDFKFMLPYETAEFRTAQALVYALDAWQYEQWKINDSLNKLIDSAKKTQENVKEYKECRTYWIAQSNFAEHSATSKQIENGIFQLCHLINLDGTTTAELFKKVITFINFNSFI
jgi:prenyltransferase beta subunit